VILYSDSGSPSGVKDALEEQCKKRQYHSVTGINYSGKSFDPVGLVKRMSEAGTDAVFMLRFGAEEVALLKEAGKANWSPYFFIPGAAAGREILDVPPIFKGKVFLSFPTLPSDETREGFLEYRALAEKHKLSQRQLGAQFSAYCAAKILVEALKLSGKELSREKLIKTLEGFYEFDTGLSPRITYGPNRRIGALGAYIVSIDPEKKQFIPASGWITPD
jgi:ABC-type branched-subunit amino acid transport system substrate-binding protein